MSSTPPTPLEKLEKALDDWEMSLGLRPPRSLGGPQEHEAERLLELSREDLRRLLPQECAENVVLLACYARYIDRMARRCQAAANWLGRKLERDSAGRTPPDRNISFRERHDLALRNDESLRLLENRRALLQARYEDLAYEANRIREVASSYESLGNTKWRTKEKG